MVAERSAGGGTLIEDGQEGADVAEFSVDAFLERYRERAQAVKDRGIPPVEGEARRAFIEQAELDFMDFSLVGAASASVEDGHLVLRVPLG